MNRPIVTKPSLHCIGSENRFRIICGGNVWNPHRKDNEKDASTNDEGRNNVRIGQGVRRKKNLSRTIKSIFRCTLLRCGAVSWLFLVIFVSGLRIMRRMWHSKDMRSLAQRGEAQWVCERRAGRIERISVNFVKDLSSAQWMVSFDLPNYINEQEVIFSQVWVFSSVCRASRVEVIDGRYVGTGFEECGLSCG